MENNNNLEAREDSEVDEEEIRDQMHVEETPAVQTVQYEIKILCAKEILMGDGTTFKVQCIRGE